MFGLICILKTDLTLLLLVVLREHFSVLRATAAANSPTLQPCSEQLIITVLVKLGFSLLKHFHPLSVAFERVCIFFLKKLKWILKLKNTCVSPSVYQGEIWASHWLSPVQFTDVCVHFPQSIHKAAKKSKRNGTVAYFGRVTFKVPTGRISIDFPQNLFFHLISECNLQMWKKDLQKLKRPKSPHCSDPHKCHMRYLC